MYLIVLKFGTQQDSVSDYSSENMACSFSVHIDNNYL